MSRCAAHITFTASLQQVCTGRELGLSVARCTNRHVLRLAATVLCAYSVADVPHCSCTRRTSSPPADCNGRRSSDIPKRYAGARDTTTFARSVRNNWIPKRDGYIHTYKLFPRCDA